MLAAALEHADRGFAVFGVLGDCRTPFTHKGRFEHGCHDATKDPAEVRWRWSVAHPRGNVACAMGEPSGVFVLDVDCKAGGDGFTTLRDLEARYGALPASWRSSTPSGGEHRWFRFVPEASVLRNWAPLRIHHDDGSKTVCPGLDLRTTGGSVALPPSRKPHGPYAWVDHPDATPLADPPDWLLRIFLPLPAPPRSLEPLRLSSTDRAARYVAAAVDSECVAVARMGPGGRNLRLFQASANLGSFVGADLLSQDAAEGALERAAADCGLVQDDGPRAVAVTIASGLRRGMSNPREVAL